MANSATDSYEARSTTGAAAGGASGYSVLVCGSERGMWRVTLSSGRSYTIGRESSSDIVLDYPCVSQRHAVILGGDPPRLIDLGSRNGTAVDSRRVVPGTVRELASGNVIDVAGISLLIQGGAEPEAPPTCGGGSRRS